MLIAIVRGGMKLSRTHVALQKFPIDLLVVLLAAGAWREKGCVGRVFPLLDVVTKC